MSSFFYLVLCFLILSYNKKAYGLDNQGWVILKHSTNLGSALITSQLQYRYSQNSDSIYEEQFNLAYHKIYNSNRFALLFTFGTNDFYSSVKEYRIGLEYEKVLRIKNDINYKIRLRQEVRDFSDFEKLAFRFRWRNQIDFKIKQHYFNKVFISNEINAYQNDFIKGSTGFSSIRTIFGLRKALNFSQLEIAYVYDSQLLTESIDRHALQLSFLF